jgi:hypothetical protein
LYVESVGKPMHPTVNWRPLTPFRLFLSLFSRAEYLNAKTMQTRNAAITAMTTPIAMLAIAPAERPYGCAGEKAEVIEDVDDVAEGLVLPLALN